MCNACLFHVENIKGPVAVVFCNHKVLRKLLLTMVSFVVVVILFLYILFM